MENELQYLKRELQLTYHQGRLFEMGALLSSGLIGTFGVEDARQYIIDSFHGSYEDVFNSIKI